MQIPTDEKISDGGPAAKRHADMALLDAIHSNRAVTMQGAWALREIAGSLAYMGATGPATELRAIAEEIEISGKRVSDAYGSALVAENRSHMASVGMILTKLVERLPAGTARQDPAS